MNQRPLSDDDVNDAVIDRSVLGLEWASAPSPSDSPLLFEDIWPCVVKLRQRSGNDVARLNCVLIDQVLRVRSGLKSSGAMPANLAGGVGMRRMFATDDGKDDRLFRRRGALSDHFLSAKFADVSI